MADPRPVSEPLEEVVDGTANRTLLADKLLWEPLRRWRGANPELDRIHFLKTVPFFDQMSHRHLKNVSGIMFERSYDAGEVIFEEGQPGAALFLILEGRVAIELCRQDNTVVLATLEKGAFFGEMALVNEAPRSADARALDDTWALALYRNDLSELIHRDPQAACQIYRSLASMISDRLRLTNELVHEESAPQKPGVA
jgi:CRP/FNR family transcriptional regulator, cyclic AMP receptor protein